MIKCDICGKESFKSLAGLEGHKKILHGVDKRKTYPDDVSKRLEALESKVGGLMTGEKFEEAMTVVREDFERLYDFTGLLPHAGQLQEVVEKAIEKKSKEGWITLRHPLSFMEERKK